MPDLSQWFLTCVLGPLLLPLFMLMLLCMIAGARPDPIINAFISVITSVISGFFDLLASVITALLRAVTPQRKYPPSKYPPPRYPPRN